MIRRLIWVAGIVALFVLTGCAQSDNRSERERPGGFYGSVSGGATILTRGPDM